MASTDLTDKFCRFAAPPASGNRIYYDTRVRGFGLRVTATGARAFILNYRTASGVERRHTIGAYPEIGLVNARKRAASLKDEIRHHGADPVGDRTAERDAPTITELCEQFLDEHVSRKRPATQVDYRAMVNKIILPAWKSRKVADIKFADVEALHRRITTNGGRDKRPAPYRANRTLAMLSAMFRFARRHRWISELPTDGVERNQEAKRYRYLSPVELDALLSALSERDQRVRSRSKVKCRDRAADIVRLLLLTGARRGEVCSMRWCDVDLGRGIWTKPSAHTKQKREHRIPLSGPTRQLLSEIRSQHKSPPAEDDLLFPGVGTNGPQTTLKKSWSSIRQRATVILFAGDEKSPAGSLVNALRRTLQRDPTLAEVDAAAKPSQLKLPVGLRNFRLHDLRHSYASFLVSEGLSLPTIGALLGHTQAQTTHRYAHLFDDPLRKATERIGEIVTGASASGNVINIRQVS